MTFLEAADAQLAADVRELLRPMLADYQSEKERTGALDFLDLLLHVRNLLRDHAVVRAALQDRYDRVFVDEFQDTDPLQADIVLLLTSDDASVDSAERVRPTPGKLFVVGDPKQSIYRFRRADMGVYDAVKQQLLDAGAVRLELSTNFRAVPEIQSLVNASFSPLMGHGSPSVQAPYVPLHPFRESSGSRPAVICLPAPNPFGDFGTVFQGAIANSYPEAVGAFVEWLLSSSGWSIPDPETGESEPVRARDVCLLFRRMQSFGRDVSQPYARALEERGVPLATASTGGFFDREEVSALSMALSAIERPTDEFRMYSTLRGPFFGFTDDALLVAKERLGGLRPFGSSEMETIEPDLRDALEALGTLHRDRNRRPIVETLNRFLELTRAHALLACWPSGALALRHVSRLQELARSFERRSATSFRGFVHYLEEGASVGSHRAVVESDAGVHLMTVHSAKGLEFPVVILADPTVSRHSTHPSRFVDHRRHLWAASVAGLVPNELREHSEEIRDADDAEELRVAYVAATRARDLLVVPTVGEGRVDGWVDVYRSAVYPTRARQRSGGRAEGCPEFGDDSVVARGPRVQSGPSDSIKPGWYPELAGGAGAVWWDPSVLELSRRVSGGVTHSRLFEEGEADGSGSRAFAEWSERHESVTRRASVPSRTVESVTAWAAGQSVSEASTSLVPSRYPVERTDVKRRGRPHGPRFGTLVHAILADVPLALSTDERSSAVRGLAQALGRVLAAPEDEVAAAQIAVDAAIDHALLRRAAKSTDVRREVQVVIPAEKGRRVIEGVIDLAFEEPSGWVVVDYKTDEGADELRYHAQLRAYVDAVARSSGRPTHGFLLLV